MRGRYWALVEESVAFGQSHHAAAYEAATTAGLDESHATRISNLALVGGLEPHLHMALGIIRGGRPQILLSNTDRNFAYDLARQAMESGT